MDSVRNYLRYKGPRARIFIQEEVALGRLSRLLRWRLRAEAG